MHLRRLLLSAFGNMKAFHLRQQSYKALSRVTALKISYCALFRWKMEYLRTDIAKKLGKRRDTRRVFKALQGLRGKTKEMKRLRLIGNKILAKKNQLR